jgi:hypothetical protein
MSENLDQSLTTDTLGEPYAPSNYFQLSLVSARFSSRSIGVAREFGNYCTLVNHQSG